MTHRNKPVRRIINGGELGALGMSFMELGFTLLCNIGYAKNKLLVDFG